MKLHKINPFHLSNVWQSIVTRTYEQKKIKETFACKRCFSESKIKRTAPYEKYSI